MINSMTGYGKSVVSTDSMEISIEVKSVNNRYLDITVKQPVQFLEFELDIRNVIKSMLKRGSLNVYINIQKRKKGSGGSTFNMENLESIHSNLVKISEKLDMKKPRWSDILGFDEIYDRSETLDDNLKENLLGGVKAAVTQLIEFRKEEGEKLSTEILGYIGNIAEVVKTVDGMKDSCTEVQFNRLKDRIENNLKSVTVDEERLCQELAIISDKVDISEEVTRLKSHLDLFNSTISSEESLGQRLNFITQEMHREANTISAKTNLTDISHYSVTLKENIEKIREQVQNIE